MLVPIDISNNRCHFQAFNYGTGIPRSPFIDLDDIAFHGKNSSTFMVFVSRGGL
jgi:hypothetical protein